MCNSYRVDCVKRWSKPGESLYYMGLLPLGYIEEHFWKVLCRSMQCTELYCGRESCIVGEREREVYCGHFCRSQDKDTKCKAKAHCSVWSARCSSIYTVQCSAVQYIHGAIQGRDRCWIVAALGTITIRLYSVLQGCHCNAGLPALIYGASARRNTPLK